MAKVKVIPPPPAENSYEISLSQREVNTIYLALRSFKYQYHVGGMEMKPLKEFDEIEKLELLFSRHAKRYP